MGEFKVTRINDQPDKKNQPAPKKSFDLKKNLTKKNIIVGIAIVFVVVILVGFGMANAYLSSITKSIFADGQGISLNTLLGSGNVDLKGKDTDRTNIMIYGLTLDERRTDTIILASYYWNEHKLVLLNIPRDIYAQYDGYNSKIVSLYAIGKSLSKGDKSYPAQFMSDFISQEYGIPIDYWVVANMDAFKKLVDTLGGITVNVEKPFTDYQYPTDNYSGYIWPPPSFDAGIQTMDGTKALIYARSRHASGSEGSDFARSHRQQIIIRAIIQKLKDQGVLGDINKMNDYLNIFGQNIFTNLTPTEAFSFAQIIKGLNLSQDYLLTNWSTSSGFLCSGMDKSGQYVLLYGIPGNCRVKGGVGSVSPYKQQAIDYVQNLLLTAEQGKTSN